MNMSFTTKIRNLDEAVLYREQLRMDGCKVILTNGVFDLLHRGHIYSLYAAVETCFGREQEMNTKIKRGEMALFVAINSDESVKKLKGPTRPVQTSDDRAFTLAALEMVDAVFVFCTPRLDAEIRMLKPDYYAKSGDYTLDNLDAGERNALESVGSTILFVPFMKGYSTTELIKKIAAAAKAGAM